MDYEDKLIMLTTYLNDKVMFRDNYAEARYKAKFILMLLGINKED
jgi:hypothetical protein